MSLLCDAYFGRGYARLVNTEFDKAITDFDEVL